MLAYLEAGESFFELTNLMKVKVLEVLHLCLDSDS